MPKEYQEIKTLLLIMNRTGMQKDLVRAMVSQMIPKAFVKQFLIL